MEKIEEQIEEKIKLKPLLKKGKVRIYKSADGTILRSGAYVDPVTGNDLFADKKKFNWVEHLEADASDTTDVHIAQIDIKDGKIIKDLDWSKKLMPASEIIAKHQRRMQSEIDLELEKETPDTGKVLKLMHEQKKIRAMRFKKDFRKNPPKEVYEIALKNLNSNIEAGGTDKPKIKKALKDKIAEYA